MYILFSLIFLLSITAGAAWAYINEMTAVGYLASIAVSGFVGSSIIALVFSYLYFYQKATGKEKIQRLQQEINDMKQTKRIGQ